MYVGYMYGNNDDGVITESSEVDTTWAMTLSSTAKYVFGSEYIFDKNTNQFKLSGTIIKSTIKEYQEKYNNPGYYTCFLTNEDGTCEKLSHALRRSNDTSMKIKYVEYSTTSYNQAHENINNSDIKTYLDNWYKENLNGYASKLSSKAYFCNDRSLSNTSASGYNNLGYGQNPTLYKAYDRLGGWGGSESSPAFIFNPSLICNQANDKFTVDKTSGNGKLIYPVGLITADELLMAGANPDKTNPLFYLYSGSSFFTMTPSFYRALTGNVQLYTLNGNGLLQRFSTSYTALAIRPVINIDPNQIEFSGNGTMQDPYILS